MQFSLQEMVGTQVLRAPFLPRTRRGRRHVALDENSHVVVLAVGKHLNGFAELARHLARGVVGDGNHARTSRRYVVFREVGNGASARRMHIVDDEFGIAHVAELERAGLHRRIRRKSAQVDGGFFELYDRVFLLCTNGECRHECEQDADKT